MVALRRAVLYLMIPMHLLCIAWVWIGRLFFGIGGWTTIIFTFTGLPVVVVGLALTSLLAFAQPARRTGGRLGPGQALTHVALWLAMAGFGYFVVDATDVPDSDRSIYLLTAGDGALDRSLGLSQVFLWACVALYLLLFVLLVLGLRCRSGAAAGPHGPQHPRQPPPPPGYG